MSTEYDVIIIGGAFSGSSEGILLKRARPETRVLIVETQTAFTLHGGESTSAVAGCFLTRVLRQHSWLVRHQLPQHGLRFWFNSQGKYEYMGDLELMWAATLLDLGTYFTGPVHSVYDRTDHAFSKLPHLGLRGLFFGWWMGLSHRRLAAIARLRMAAGVYGCRNLDQRKLIQPDFTPGPAAVKIIWAGLQQWLKLEIHAWFLKPRPDHKPTIPALKRVAPPTPTSSTPTSTADPT